MASLFPQISVLGIDRSARQLDYARDKARANGLENCRFNRDKVQNLSHPLVNLAKGNKAALKRLTYYKQEELDLLLGLPPEPGLLLLHDWPVAPPHFSSSGIRPEKILVERLRPRWICSGHHHTSMESQIGPSNFIALNIVTRGDDSDASSISAGWAAVFTWTGERLEKVALWPPAKHSSAMV